MGFIENKRAIVPKVKKAIAAHPNAIEFIYETGSDDHCAVLKVFYASPQTIWDSMHNNMGKVLEVKNKFSRTGIKPAYIDLGRGESVDSKNADSLFVSEYCNRLEIVIL